MAEINSDGSATILSPTGNTWVYPDPSTGQGGAWRFEIVSNGATGSITVVGRAHTAPTTVAMNPVPYRSDYLNGAVGTGLPVSTAITGTSIIIVPASGMSVGLQLTALSAGSYTVYATPIAEYVN